MLKRMKKLLALVLTLCMVATVIPTDVLAAELNSSTFISEIAEASTEIKEGEQKEEEATDIVETSGTTETTAVESNTTEDTSVEENASSEGGKNTTEAENSTTDNQLKRNTEQKNTQTDDVDSVPLDESMFYRIFHLDCGRKYFTVEQIKDIIDKIAKNGYSHLELAIGNDGLRFLLDDMSVKTENGTYISANVKTGIKEGNKNYHNFATNELTESEMNLIIEYAISKNISIIPLINTPGHMDAIIDCMEYVGIQNPAYQNSTRTVDVSNESAVEFTLALVNKYIEYFSKKGCKIFNMGCDEYANDIGNDAQGFANLIKNNLYGEYIEFVNAMAAQVKQNGMTPMAFNDGIYYNSNTNYGTFDSDIAVAYWTSGWSGYNTASASFLENKGHKIINTNDAWYYVLGRSSGTYGLQNAVKGVANTGCTQVAGNSGAKASGCMICLWCDTPGADYSDEEKDNVDGLITALAMNNQDYFVVSSDGAENGGDDLPNDGDVSNKLEERTVTVTVNGTTVDIIDDVNCADEIQSSDLNEGIATVEAKDIDEEGSIVKKLGNKINVSKSSTSKGVISDGKGNYLKIDSNGDISNTTDINEATEFSITKTENSDNYQIIGNGRYLKCSNSELSANTSSSTWKYSNSKGFYSSSRSSNYYLKYATSGQWTAVDNGGDSGYLYSVTSTTTDSVKNTKITFTGVTVGTTYVTVGNVRYTIKVVAENLSNARSLTLEYWITNIRVTADGAQEKTVTASQFYGEEGVDVETVLPEKGTWSEGEVVYWKGTVHKTDNKQTEVEKDDKTAEGKDFSKLRYFSGDWQYQNETGSWITIEKTDQVVIYWLQTTDITDEVTTLMKDWGFYPDSQGDNEKKVALTVAVVYPDGTVSPAENDMYDNSTIIFNYWGDRDIGIVAPINNSDYAVSKITVTDGKRNQTGTGKWGTNDTITWKKTTTAAGTTWYDETTYWEKANGGTPMINGKIQSIVWYDYNTAKLVLIYLEPVHRESNLQVVWYNDTGKETIKTQEIVVNEDTTFLNGLKNGTHENAVGPIILEDNAYIVNSSGIQQQINKDLTIMPDVLGKYSSGLYKYVSADISEDGKTLTLHYKLKADIEYNALYMLDYGLSVKIPLADLIANVNDVSTVSVPANTAYDKEQKQLIYTPDNVLLNIEPLVVTVTYNNNDTVSLKIGIVPATTVYYEEGFAAYEGSWSETKDIGKKFQETEKIKYENGGYVSSKTSNYGYDPVYAQENAGASNGTEKTSEQRGDKAAFTFKGTGVDICSNTTVNSGILFINVKNANGKSVKNIIVDTHMESGQTDATGNQGVSAYNVPIASITGLERDTYTITITHISNDENAAKVSIDGFRVYGTIDENNDYYKADLEDNPVYFEIRSKVLSSLAIEATGDNQSDVVLPDENAAATAVVVSSTANYSKDTAEDLLNNGPKNEIYLYKNQALVFKITTKRQVQIGLRALNAATNCNVVDDNGNRNISLNSSSDMNYSLNAKNDGETTITITNTGEGILAITKLKVCDDPDIAFNALGENDFDEALYALGLKKRVSEESGKDNTSSNPGGDATDNPNTTPSTPDQDNQTSGTMEQPGNTTETPGTTEQPEDTTQIPNTDKGETDISKKKATLTIHYVTGKGQKVAQATATAEGEEGKSITYTAKQVKQLAKSNLPKGYVLRLLNKYKNVQVKYGDSASITVKVVKAFVPKKASVKKAVSTKKKQMKVTWKKVNKASGYKVFYSTDQDFRKNVKTVTVKGNKTFSKTIKGLKAGKTYYVRVKAYTKTEGQSVYGSFSKVQKVKIKK